MIFTWLFLILGLIAVLFSLNAIRTGRVPTYFRPFFGGAKRKENKIKYWLQIISILLIGLVFFYIGIVSYLNM